MEAILKFNLPEDRRNFEVATKATDYYCALWDFDQYLRGILKHGCEGFKESENNTVEKLRKQLHELMEDNNVRFEE